jgi:hypothetical protein
MNQPRSKATRRLHVRLLPNFCIAANAVSGSGHSGRINGAKTCPVCLRSFLNWRTAAIAAGQLRSRGRDKRATDIIATLIDVHAETTPGD